MPHVKAITRHGSRLAYTPHGTLAILDQSVDYTPTGNPRVDQYVCARSNQLDIYRDQLDNQLLFVNNRTVRILRRYALAANVAERDAKRHWNDTPRNVRGLLRRWLMARTVELMQCKAVQ